MECVPNATCRREPKSHESQASPPPKFQLVLPNPHQRLLQLHAIVVDLSKRKHQSRLLKIFGGVVLPKTAGAVAIGHCQFKSQITAKQYRMAECSIVTPS